MAPKNIIIGLGAALLGLVSVFLMLLFSPVLIPYVIYRNSVFMKKYTAYLQANEGKQFFCYTKDPASHPIAIGSFIEQELLPALPHHIHPFIIDGKSTPGDTDRPFISKMLEGAGKGDTPSCFIVKIFNGKPVVQSIRKEIYETLNGHQSMDQLTEQLYTFSRMSYTSRESTANDKQPKKPNPYN